MRVLRIGAPWVMYLACVPLLAGAAFLGFGRWTLAVILFVIGGAWYIAAALWFAQRVSKLRRSEHLTSRDRIEVEYPRWARRGARGYLMLMAGMTGVLILGSVIFVVVALAMR
jgi:hypothetical protein